MQSIFSTLFSKLKHMVKDFSYGLKFVLDRKLTELFNDNFHVLQSFSVIDLSSIVQFLMPFSVT